MLNQLRPATSGASCPSDRPRFGLAEGANLPANSDFVRRIVFSRLTDCADRGIPGNRAFTQLICEKCRSYQ